MAQGVQREGIERTDRKKEMNYELCKNNIESNTDWDSGFRL